MTTAHAVLADVRAALASEPRVGPDHGLRLAYGDDGVLTMEGEVANVAAKRLALERAAAHPAVRGIVDRVRVAPATPMGDEAIRNAVRDALLADTAFAEIALFEHDAGRLVAVQQPSVHGRTGEIRIRVEDGVVTLEGEVPGLGLKRLAGVLAWWVPGSRDVVNGLGVAPPEADNDGEVADAVRIALEKDPFVDAGQIRVHARNWRVILEGLVRGEAEREMAEFDAWYVSGVDAVDNRIAVRA